MPTPQAEQFQHPVLQAVMHWVQDWGARRARRALFVEHGRGELEVIARDYGLTPRQMREVARRAPETSDLLPLRLATLGLSMETLARTHPRLLADMQARCRTCDSKGACTWDLAQDPARGAWRRYCENAPALAALGV